MNLNEAIQRAAQFANQGRFADAEKTCRDILAANDKFHPAYHLLGQLALQGGRPDLAAGMLQKAAALDGNRASYHRDLGEVLFYGGKLKDAMMIINRALGLDANDAKTHFVAGMVMMTAGDKTQAIKAFETAIKLAPDYGPAYNNLGSLLEAAGKMENAKSNYEKAIEIDKNNAQAQTNLASILIAEGDSEQAKEHLDLAIEVRPDYIEAHHNLSALKTYKKGDVHIEILERLSQDPSKLPPENQTRLAFILAKLHADLGNHDMAFAKYNTANQLKRESFDYNEKKDAAFITAIKSTFTKSFFKGIKKTEQQNPTPIFIVGMPRSGSTLIEQILSGHSDVHAAGELSTLSDIIKSKIKDFPNDTQEMPDHELENIGEEYLNAVRALDPEARYIVDKMPANYRFAGLIAKILPDARIINTARNPMDCCFSNFTHLFLHTMHFAYDLSEIGRYHNRYQDLMTHWHKVLPEGVLTDVGYEDVVSDLEGEARKLTQFIGLDWQDSCLDFQKNKTLVTTASAAQVRKPIYKTSIERWKPYEKHLGSLIDALDGK